MVGLRGKPVCIESFRGYRSGERSASADSRVNDRVG